MKDKDINFRTPDSDKHMTEVDWIMLTALFLAVWLLMVLRYLNI
jgi:hypothetical protein